jgi:transcriptional regulator with XRE-family HTH domain
VEAVSERFPLGPNLRAARREKGIPAERVALAIGKSVYTIHSYECGRVMPPANVLADLATYLQVSADSLLGLENSERTPLPDPDEEWVQKILDRPRPQVYEFPEDAEVIW